MLTGLFKLRVSLVWICSWMPFEPHSSLTEFFLSKHSLLGSTATGAWKWLFTWVYEQECLGLQSKSSSSSSSLRSFSKDRSIAPSKVQPTALFSNFQYLLFFLRSSSSCLHLIPCPIPSTFPSITQGKQGKEIIPLSKTDQNSCVTHQVSYSLPGIKRPERYVDHSPP